MNESDTCYLLEQQHHEQRHHEQRHHTHHALASGRQYGRKHRTIPSFVKDGTTF